MERGEELMELNRAAFDRNTQAFERVMAALDRHEQLFEEARGNTEDLKVFIRETNRRSEKVLEEMLRRNAEFNEEQSRRTDRIVARLDDAREESKAHREALLALIDRLPPPAQAA
jgi:hypothetical protein